MKRAITLGLIAGAIVLGACADDRVAAPTAPTAPAAPDQTVLGGLLSRPFLPGQQQPTVDLSRGFTYAIYPPGIGQNLVQTFTPASNEWLGHVQLPIGCATGVGLHLRIREGIGGPIISDRIAVGLPNVVDGTLYAFQVYTAATDPRGIRIYHGRTYAIELSAHPSGGAENSCGIAPGPAGDSYSGGQGWYEDVPINGPGFLPLPAGEDLPFITLVR